MTSKNEDPILKEERFGTFVRMDPTFDALYSLIYKVADLHETSPSYWMKMLSIKGWSAFPFDGIIPENEIRFWADSFGPSQAVAMWKQAALEALASQSINDCYDINLRSESIKLGELPFPSKPMIICELEKLAD